MKRQTESKEERERGREREKERERERRRFGQRERTIPKRQSAIWEIDRDQINKIRKQNKKNKMKKKRIHQLQPNKRQITIEIMYDTNQIRFNLTR